MGEGLVHRAASPTDRRTQVVRLTPTGRRALHAMTHAHEEWIDSLFAGLSHDDCAQLYALLGRLRGSITDGLASSSAEERP